MWSQGNIFPRKCGLGNIFPGEFHPLWRFVPPAPGGTNLPGIIFPRKFRPLESYFLWNSHLFHTFYLIPPLEIHSTLSSSMSVIKKSKQVNKEYLRIQQHDVCVCTCVCTCVCVHVCVYVCMCVCTCVCVIVLLH